MFEVADFLIARELAATATATVPAAATPAH